MTFLNSLNYSDYDPPLSKQPPVDVEKLKHLYDEFNTISETSGTSIYNLGLDYYNTFSALPLSGFIDERIFTPQPSLSFSIINYSVPLMQNWISDPNSMEFVSEETGELIDERLEADVRAEFTDTKLMIALQKAFIDGYALVCSSPRDATIWVPDAEDIAVDWIHMDFFSAKRTIIGPDGTKMEILQGCFNQYGQWFEFEIQENDVEGQIWPVARPTMVPFIYNIHPINRVPFGIPRALVAIEKEKQAVERAIYQIVTRHAAASTLVSGDIQDRYIDNFYRNKIVVIKSDNPGFNLRDNVFPLPSRIEDITTLAARVDQLTERAIKQCGLQVLRGPQDVQASTSEVAEINAYQASTVTMRNMVERCLNGMAIIFNNVLERQLGEPNLAYCNVTHNPIDALQELAAIEKMLPGLEAAVQKDPDNVISLGLFPLESLGKMYEKYLRLNKISSNIMAPKAQRITGEMARGILTDRAKEQENEAAQVLALAEVEKAKAALANAEVNAQKVLLDAEKKDQEATLKLQKLEIDNFKAIADKKVADFDAIKKLAASYKDLEGDPEAQGAVVSEVMDALKAA